MYTGCWCEDLSEGDRLEDPGINGGDNTKMVLHKVGWGERGHGLD